MPGWWSVPNNPVSAAVTPITRTPGIADILPAAYSVPQNPIKDYVEGNRKMIGQTGCGCAGSCGGCGTVNGMAGFTEDWTGISAKFGTGDYMGAAQAPLMGVPLWGWAAGVAALLILPSMMGGGGRKRR